MPKKEDLEAAHERGYVEGRRRTLINQLSQTLSDLQGFQKAEDEPLIKLARAVQEREEAIQVLRRTCADFGDLDWKEDLHLSDIIDKHLVCHLS